MRLRPSAHSLCLLLGLFAFCAAGPVFCEEAAKAHVAVLGFANETGNPSYDAACQAAADTLALALRQIGRYQVEIESGPSGGEEGLRASAEAGRLDFILYGRMSKAGSGGIDCSLSLFDRAKGRTALSRSGKAAGVLDIFDAMDELVVSVLESMTGSHIGFGSVELKNSGEKGSYAVLVDGYPAGQDLEALDRVLIGKRKIEIVQKRLLGTRTVASARVEVREGESSKFEFAVPALLDEERARLEGLEAAIAAGWGEPSSAAAVDAALAQLAALLGDLSFSPALSKYKDEARQLGGAWALSKCRRSIEGSAWEPQLELLDAGAAIYSASKSYPSPEKIRAAFQEDAALLGTFFELQAGNALAEGDFDQAMLSFEDALMVSTRYLGGDRLADYAYAISTLKEIQGKAGTEARDEAETVFGPWMKAGKRFFGLRAGLDAGSAYLVVASDFTRSLSVDGGESEAAPLALRLAQGAQSHKVKAEGSEGPFDLALSPGSRILFARDGAAPFGKIAAGYGTLELTSEPPGMQVILDKGETLTTPLRVQLPPGPHSYEVEQTIIDQKFYAEQQEQWVNVNAGEKIHTDLNIEAAFGQLSVELAPPGYDVFVNDKEIGVTPLAPVNVDAGFLKVRFERKGEKSRQLWAGLRPGMAATVSWGWTAETAVQPERRSIMLDGRGESWDGLEPLYEARTDNYFLGATDSGIQRVYLCSDDQYLYWRVDFLKANPFWKLPHGVKTGVALQLYVDSFEGRKNFNMDLNYQSDINQTWGALSIWDGATRRSEEVWRNAISVKQGETMLVARVPLDAVIKYCRGPLRLAYQLSALDEHHKWTQTDNSFIAWVDFAKIAADRPEAPTPAGSDGPETAIQLEKRSIELDGRPDSWAGVAPIFSGSTEPDSFLGRGGSGLVAVYLCHDAKYLYARLDFEKTDPFWKIPKEAVVGLGYEMSIQIDDSRRANFGLTYNRGKNAIEAYGGIWDDKKGWNDLGQGKGITAYKVSPTMLVVRVSLGAVSKYCGGVHKVSFEVANQRASNQRDEQGSVTSPWTYVEFPE